MSDRVMVNVMQSEEEAVMGGMCSEVVCAKVETSFGGRGWCYVLET